MCCQNMNQKKMLKVVLQKISNVTNAKKCGCNFTQNHLRNYSFKVKFQALSIIKELTTHLHASSPMNQYSLQLYLT